MLRWVRLPDEQTRWFVASIVVGCLTILLCDGCCGQLYPLTAIKEQAGSRLINSGTCVCIGLSRDGRQGLFLTAKHVVDGAGMIQIDDPAAASDCYRVSIHPTDDVAAFVCWGEFKPMPMTADELPSMAPVLVCGYGPKYNGTGTKVCFNASVERNIVFSQEHVISGDSGGPVYTSLEGQEYLVGIVSGFIKPEGTPRSTSRTDGQSRETIMVPVSRICQWLPTQYQNCPQCVPLQAPSYRGRSTIRYSTPPEYMAPVRPVTPQVVNPLIPIGPPTVVNPPPSQVVIAPCQDDIRRMVIEYMQQNPPPAGPAGQDGRDGTNGRDGHTVSAAEVSAYLLQHHRSEITGPVGQTGAMGPAGPPGERGLVGVPDNEDIRNWLIGASSDPETRGMLAAVLADLVGEDPRVQSILQRLEVLENAPTESAAKDPRVDTILARLEALETRPVPDPISTPIADDRRFLYFTSTEGCSQCRGTDSTVNRLKALGYPITVIDLDPNETEVRGVPRIHILSDNRSIFGQSDVATYLGLLVP